MSGAMRRKSEKSEKSSKRSSQLGAGDCTDAKNL